jgi:RNA polymerase sigma-70 factor, ECF subfamily
VIVCRLSCDEPYVRAADSLPNCHSLMESGGAQTEVAARPGVPEGLTAALDLRALFDAHYTSVWRLLRRFGVASSQLDDAAQEVFWVAARRLADIQPGKEHAFLYGVALRIASNNLRRKKSAPDLAELVDVTQLSDQAPSAEERIEQQQARQLLDAVLDRMPLDLRTAFVLVELEGLALRDVAELEDIPLGTASSRLRRAREEFSNIAQRIRRALATRGGNR